MDPLSPPPNRRSRKIAPIGQADEEVAPEDLMDLEDERLRSRQQVVDDMESMSRSNARLSISEKSVSEHYHSCIQLAAENKINIKNAFNFKLIDLLHSMFSKKKPIKDFTEVSSSLDAGVKIYSCRVDSVHNDTLKMATTVCSGNKGRRDDEDQEADAGDSKNKKKTRRTKKTTIATAKDIDRPPNNNCENCTYDILTNDNLITSSAIFDSDKVCWHLNALNNFWENEKPIRHDHQKITVDSFPDIPDNIFICSMFKNFRFGDDTSNVKPFIEEKVSAAFKIDYEPPPTDGFFDDDDGFQNDENISNFEASNNEFVEPQDPVTCLSRMMSSSDFVSEISKLIANETSDYRYFDFQQIQKKLHPRNTQHWAPLRKKSTIGGKRIKEEKKEPIDFSNDDNDDNFKVFDLKNDPTCTLNTVTSREKFLMKQITDFSVNKFFKLNVWREMFVIQNANAADEGTSELEEMIDDYNYDNPNDTQNTLPEHYEDDYCDEQDNNAPEDVHEAMEKNALLKDNLVEVPNKVAKFQLPYTMKDKSVNMKELKSKIWKEIESSEEKVKNESAKKAITFVEICRKIMNEDSDTTKDLELSIPIVFNAILQLANDKTLAFSSPEDQTDFIVSVDSLLTCSSGS